MLHKEIFASAGTVLPQYQEINFTGTYDYDNSVVGGFNTTIIDIMPVKHNYYNHEISIVELSTAARSGGTVSAFTIDGFYFNEFEFWVVIEVTYNDGFVNKTGLIINEAGGALCSGEVLGKGSKFSGTPVSCTVRIYDKYTAPKAILTITNTNQNSYTLFFYNKFIGQEQNYERIIIPGNSSVTIPTYIGVSINESYDFHESQTTGFTYNSYGDCFISDPNPTITL